MTVEELIKQLQAVPDQQAMVASELGYTPGKEEDVPFAAKGVYVHPEQSGLVVIASIANASIYYHRGYRPVIPRA